MTVYLPCYVQSPALGNMATLEDDDEMVLISADELDGMHRAMPSDALSAEAESEGEGEEEEELKGTALDDYQPSDAEELELQKGTIALFLSSFSVAIACSSLLFCIYIQCGIYSQVTLW